MEIFQSFKKPLLIGLKKTLCGYLVFCSVSFQWRPNSSPCQQWLQKAPDARDVVRNTSQRATVNLRIVTEIGSWICCREKLVLKITNNGLKWKGTLIFDESRRTSETALLCNRPVINWWQSINHSWFRRLRLLISSRRLFFIPKWHRLPDLTSAGNGQWRTNDPSVNLVTGQDLDHPPPPSPTTSRANSIFTI